MAHLKTKGILRSTHVFTLNVSKRTLNHNKLNGFVSKVFLIKSSEWRYTKELRQIAYFEDPNRGFLVNEHGIVSIPKSQTV